MCLREEEDNITKRLAKLIRAKIAISQWKRVCDEDMFEQFVTKSCPVVGKSGRIARQGFRLCLFWQLSEIIFIRGVSSFTMLTLGVTATFELSMLTVIRRQASDKGYYSNITLVL